MCKTKILLFNFFTGIHPTSVAGGLLPIQDKPITVEIKRTMIFYDTEIEEARAALRANSNYYSELVGYPDSEGFTPVDEVLECK
jgi:hypothetical protein